MSSATAFINMVNTASKNLVSFLSIIICCILYSCIITVQDFYSCSRRVFRVLSYLLPVNLCKGWRGCTSNRAFKSKLDHQTTKPCSVDELGVEMPMITKEDIEIVMENLGLYLDRHRESVPQGSSTHEIVNMFDKNGPRLDEVGEVFSLFDRNNDGFIDAEELKRVMNSIGLTGFSDQDCQRMIMAFDDNGDGKIEFVEFVKLMEECSC